MSRPENQMGASLTRADEENKELGEYAKILEEERAGLMRTSSRSLSNLIKDGKARIEVVDPYGQHWQIEDEDADFDDIVPLGGGQQGKVYAALVTFKDKKGDEETRWCVLKSLGASIKSRSMHNSDDFQGASVVRLASAPLPTSFEYHASITMTANTSTEVNVIKLMGVIRHNGQDYALMPYCDMFLNGLLKGEKFQTLESKKREAVILHVMSDLLRAVLCINRMGFVHTDIKPENIGFYRGHWCLIDLDSAVKLGEKVNRFGGSPSYMHPACFVDSNNISHPGNDMHALGFVLKQLLSLPLDLSSTNLVEICKEKSAQYKEALKKKDEASTLRSLDIIVDGSGMLTEKLLEIIDHMCNGLMSKQPDVEQLIDCFDKLRAQLLSQLTADEITALECQLNQFYDQQKSVGCFDLLPELMDLSSITNSSFSRPSSLSPRLSLFSITSPTSRRDSEEDEQFPENNKSGFLAANNKKSF